MSHGGGGVRKVPKKCHVLFEWPLFPKFLRQEKTKSTTVNGNYTLYDKLIKKPLIEQLSQKLFTKFSFILLYCTLYSYMTPSSSWRNRCGGCGVLTRESDDQLLYYVRRHVQVVIFKLIKTNSVLFQILFGMGAGQGV